jgi:hypothetical protein
MRKLLRIKGHDDDDEEDDDINNTTWCWKPHWAQLRTSKAWSGNKNALTVGRLDTGLQNVPTRKRKDKWKRLVLQQMQVLRKPNPSAVTVANQVTRKRTAG